VRPKWEPVGWPDPSNRSKERWTGMGQGSAHVKMKPWGSMLGKQNLQKEKTTEAKMRGKKA